MGGGVGRDGGGGGDVLKIKGPLLILRRSNWRLLPFGTYSNLCYMQKCSSSEDIGVGG